LARWQWRFSQERNMTTDALIDRLIRIKDGLTLRAYRDAINEVCAAISGVAAKDAEIAALHAEIDRLHAEKRELIMQSLADGSQAQEALDRALAAEALVADCAKYLKDGETPRQRLDRDHAGVLSLMAMLAKDRQERDDARAEIARLTRDVAAAEAAALERAVDAVHYECWTDGDGNAVIETVLVEQATTELAIRAIRTLPRDGSALDAVVAERMAELRGIVAALADDLESEINWRLDGDHPFTVKTRDRELQIVRDARAALAKLDGEG
jgi:uncharacterized small protein (DUF1192 family)